MTVSRSETVSATPEEVWAVVSDLPGMGSLSPESTGGAWVRGTGPSVGSVFKGRNKNGWHSWSTKAVVTRSDVGRAFSFDVTAFGMPVSTWTYELEATEGGTRVTESWVDNRKALLTKSAKAVTGVGDRETYSATSIAQTLAALKARFA